MRRSAAAIALLAVLAACTSTEVAGPGPTAVPDAPSPTASPSPAAPSPPPTPTPSSSPPAAAPSPSSAHAALAARLADAVHFPAGVNASVAVLDDRGALVFEVFGRRTLLPASTAKLATGAAAFLLFGPDHRITTRVEAVGDLGEDGVLHGRLEVVGAGDPALSQADYRTLVYVARPHTELEALADAVVASGVRVVTRGVVPAPDAFGDTPEAPGWKDGYLAVLDARRIMALTVDGGLDLVVAKRPPNPELVLTAAEDPAQQAADVLRRLLRERGVVVRDDIGLAEGERAVVGEVTGPPIVDHVRFAFERSDNHTADTLFRLVGLGQGQRDWVGSGDAIGRLLAREGVDTTGMRLVDGAGLSRQDRVSARTLAGITHVMTGGEHGAAWLDALAVAGEEGTIRRRLRGTVAEGRFLGKSGTLDDATGLVGTVLGPDGQPAYHVAALANVGPGVGRFPSVVVIDDLVALLAEDAAGCTRLPPPDEVADDEYVVGGLYVDCP